jgi:hypothetical protein
VCSGGSFDCALCLEVCEEAHGVRVVTVSDILGLWSLIRLKASVITC